MTIFVGATIAEAKKTAQKQLKPTTEQTLNIKVIQEPRYGFLGIGRRPAKIEVTVKEESKQPSVVKKNETTASQHPTALKEEQTTPNLVDKKLGADNELDPAEIERRHKLNIERVQSTGLLLVGYLTDVCAKLGIEVRPVIVEAQAHELKIDMKSNESGKIIGRHGRRINALEQISSTFMNYHGAPKTLVILDTSNYRKRRAKTVTELAQRAVTEVVASGQAVFLDPMPARERKIIHQVLEDNDHVKTYSHGREPYRSVVIAPKN